ncbi:hypothetical protein [Okeania sp. SIO1I7]|uniref:nSTAND1 domain-containing NTPase n=1 Tax=Okeania sp. SIO1I7 TaxID=2607772 RepID=UPI0013F80232|nr:hypothetical protein [Okeania sp. SIO1I7]NET28411.1 hypothetical protein [Okeania sp. SIO1I7]
MKQEISFNSGITRFVLVLPELCRYFTAVVNQYIIAQHSEAEIHSRNLKPGSPYLGLNKFEPGDKDKFFGREKWIIELSNDLEKNNLLLLLGASGSGKSSLVQAGLIPYLSDQWGASQLVTIIFVPDNNPFTSFSENFPKKYQNKASNFFNSPNNLTLIDVIKSCQEESFKWIIFIDQFEELFARTPKLERDKFIASLIPLIQQQDESIKLILAMRSDFLDELQEYADLTNEVEKQIRLTREMTEIELRLAIAEPAARNGVTFEKGLVETIIHDFYHQAGSLPLLQYTLDLLWREDKPSENNRVLNIATYENIGGVSGALQKQADKIYNSELFNDEERKTAEKIFIELIDLKVKEPISRRVDRSQFRNNETINKVLEKLIDNRLLVSGRYRRSTVEVAHEQLLRSWQVLQKLINDKEEIIILRNRLFSDVQQWQRLKEENNHNAEKELWVGYNLEKFHRLINEEEFSSFDEETKKFIQASDERKKQLENEEEEKRQKELKLEITEKELAKESLEKERTKNKFLLTLVIATILSLLAGVLGWLFWQGKQQGILLQSIININRGEFESETIKLLPKMIEKGDKKLREAAKDKNQINKNIESAMSDYKNVLNFINLAQKQIKDSLAENPSKYKHIRQCENQYQDIREFSDNLDIRKFSDDLVTDLTKYFIQCKLINIFTYSREEKLLIKIIKIKEKASNSLTDIIWKYRIPKLEGYLKENKYGEKIGNKRPSDFEDQFTEGALRETYKILIVDLGADINKSGFIANEEEARRMPKKILLKIEKLWRQYTDQKCGWFGKEDNREADECELLNKYSLSRLIFYGPIDAQQRLEEVMKDSTFPNPESSKCENKTILDLQQSLENINTILDLQQSLENINKKPTKTISNYFQIIDGSGQITYSDYPLLVGVEEHKKEYGVIGRYNPSNRHMRLEISGRLVEIYLFEPLGENKTVDFVVKKIISNRNRGNDTFSVSGLPFNAIIETNFITQGTLKKVGNQIQGNFQTEGEVWLGEFISRYRGIIKGKFTLNIQPVETYNTDIPENYHTSEKENIKVITSVVEDCIWKKSDISSEF